MDGKLSSDVEVLSLPRGIYLFSVRSAAPSSAGLDGQMVLPGLHVGLCPGESPQSVEFVSAPGSSGFWLYQPGDAVVVRILSESVPLFLTSIRRDKTAPLEIEIQRLDESPPSGAAPEALPVANIEEPKRRGLRTQIIAHVQNRGDLTFLDETWAGLLNQRLWIEAFEIVPREHLQPDQIEYKALDGAGAETPWIKGGETCGARGLGVPLLGFAVRSSPGVGDGKFDVEYFGRFVSGQTAGPARNGEPVFSSRRGDPLECIHLAIVPAPSESAPISVPDPMNAASHPKRRSLGAKFGIFREEARAAQPRLQLGRWTEDLDRLLAANADAPTRQRMTLNRIFEELRALGYEGGYDAIRRHAQRWGKAHSPARASASVPFAPGEAYQFDWRHEMVVLDGVTTTASVARVRLCHSGMMFVRAYPRETQEMVFDAHERAFAFFAGACRSGIYDNMKMGAEAIFVADDHKYDRRFLEMCSHHLVEPCAPAGGRKKDQVANLAGERFFTPRPRFKSYDELNTWLVDKCLGWAKAHAHPERPERTIWEMFEEERPKLLPYRGQFDGFRALTGSASKTRLVGFDDNRYSVGASAVGRPVDIHAYADRIVIRQDGRIVAEHRRSFSGAETIYDPWHYLPAPAPKPGATRSGGPLKDRALPAGIDRVQRRLAGSNEGDRQMVEILAAVLSEGLPAVESACRQALAEGVPSSDLVLDLLSRRRDPIPSAIIATPETLRLRHAPVADCARYDRLRNA